MTSKKIIKRDETIEDFNINKIENVLKIAFQKTNVNYNDEDINNIINFISIELNNFNNDIYKIEFIKTK